MIIALTAVGENGQYGCRDTKNGLPWVCPQELAYYYEILERLLAKQETNAVIIGGRTWAGLPPPVRSTTLAMMLRNNVQNLYLFDPRNKYIELAAETSLMVMGKDVRVQRFLSIGENFGKDHSTDTVCLGGAHLIRTLLSQRLLDEAYVSRIGFDKEHPIYLNYLEAEKEYRAFFEEHESTLDSYSFYRDDLTGEVRTPDPVVRRYEELRKASNNTQKELIKYLKPTYDCTRLEELLLDSKYSKQATVLALPTVLKNGAEPLVVTTEHWNFND